MLRETGSGIAQRITRFLKPRSPSKDASHAVGRIGEGMLEPVVKSAIHNVCCLVLRGNLEQWINLCLDRTLAEQVATERVDGANPGELDRK